MENVNPRQILKNLHEVLVDAENRFSTQFIEQEIKLSETFKVEFRNYLQSKDCGVDYYGSTTVVTNKAGQKIYIANQWFAIASYFVDFCTELLTYRELFVEICKTQLFLNLEKMKEYATHLKKCASLEDKNEFCSAAKSLLNDKFIGCDEEYEAVTQYLWNFVSDYKWWAGSKTVDRHDFYISAVLNRLNVVNNNSEYLAIIVHSFASNLKLRLLVEKLDNFTIDAKENEFEMIPKNDRGYNSTQVASEPAYEYKSDSDGISISAASLARFKQYQ